MNTNTFGRVALRGGVVTGAAQIIRIVIQLLSVAILSRLLSPEDFGLMAAVGPIAAFVALFQNLGLQQAIVQRKDISELHLNQVFWISTFVGLLCTGVMLLISPLVALFYGDGRMTGITMAAAMPVFLGSMAALPLALMNRRLQFGQLAINDVLSGAIGLIVTAVCAYLGLRYWSLAIGPIAAAAVVLAASWWTTRWMPGSPTLRADKDIISFGANLTGFNLVNFFSRNLDNILIGKYSGAEALGYYDRAYKLLMFPIQNINQPLTRVMIPLMSQFQDDKPRFRNVYLRTNWLLAAVLMPGIATMTCTVSSVVNIVFGPQWAEVGPIFAWLGLASLVQPLNNTTGWIFICQGYTRTMFRWGIYSSSVSALAFIVGLQWGAVGVAAAYAISGYILLIPVLACVLHRVGPVTAFDFLSIQVTFVTSAGLSWLCFRQIAATGWITSDILSVAVAALLNYGIAAVLVVAFPTSRRILFFWLSTVRNMLVKSPAGSNGTEQAGH
ncbi:lipopolysaccharide biosynthesis protein [Allorhizobium undicola]|uniref:lipopolysaccharide biosynthesis protein n=1 Tax=Allorhizobium undicola TaxID=78527 RepID=UPI003D333052